MTEKKFTVVLVVGMVLGVDEACIGGGNTEPSSGFLHGMTVRSLNDDGRGMGRKE